MSREELNVGPVCKKRFKGVENFLKRVAFNLGNTPSQTEVKIISCIPIDVTDLQQKIVHLEKQLEEVTCVRRSSPEEVQTFAVKNNQPCKSIKPAQSNKLGQQSVHTAIIESKFLNVASEAVPCECDCDRYTCPTACLEKKKKSNVSFALQASNANTTSDILSKYNFDIYQSDDQALKSKIVDHYYDQGEKPKNVDHYYDQGVKPKKVDHYYDQEVKFNKNDMDAYYTEPQMSEPNPNNQRQTRFRKKKIIKNKKVTSPCVYYAQTYSSPFIKPNLKVKVPEYERSDVMTRSYLAAMIRKQYKPEVLGDNISQQSRFSSPICRDVPPHCEGTCLLESDICSCCHGQFHNIDAHVHKQNTFQSYMLHEMNTRSSFYDTNQYDLVPVKEKPVKIKKDLERPRKKHPMPHIDMKCWPENIRTKYRYHSLYPLPTSHHYTARPRPDCTMRDKLNSYGRKIPVTFNRIEPITRTMAKRRRQMYRRERPINIETSKSCSIDFGNMCPKETCENPIKLESLKLIPAPKKNAECLTTVINSSECQTEMSTIEENLVNNKTEVTLNQIKSILQSVLAEVKVSSQSKGQVIENKPKKDAVVQKGQSHNNMQASSLMNSITYSPYAISPPPYVTSCSRQMSPTQFCYPQGGMKCFHNFPVFIQNPGGRHMCSSCYRSSPIRPGCTRQATTTATNTEKIKEHSKETEKLIKEIYKSMALNVDYPNKDTSRSECDEIMKSLHGYTAPIILKTEPKKQPKIIRNGVQAVSELFLKKDIIETSDTLNSTVESKLPSHEASMRSHAVTSTDTELRMRKDRLEKYLRTRNKQPVVPEVEKKTFREAMVQNANSITESETSSSESDTDTTVVGKVQKEAPEHKHKKGKEGLLTKMFKSVKLFNTREKQQKRIEKAENEVETTSDSDDYQTIYSQKIEKNLRHRSRPHNLPKRKTHSKISYKQAYQRDRSPEKKRPPYMEQEYRRYWDEKLMFHNNRPRYSSERQYSEQSSPRKPAYYQTYEARHMHVEPNRHVPEYEPRTRRQNDNDKTSNLKYASKGMAWLKKHKVGIRCGKQWKKFILES